MSHRPLRLLRVFRYYPRLAAWGGAWAGLTLAALVLHRLCWATSGGWADAARPVANAVHLLATPGWIVNSRLPGVRYSTSGPAAALAFGLSFGGYLGVLAAGLAARRWLLQVEPAAVQPVGVLLTRRRFLVDGSFAVATLGGAGALSKGSLLDPWDLTLARYTVPVRGLPAALDGLRLVQISDTHLGPRVPSSFVRRAVEMALSRQPDVFLLTGDYIHNGWRFIEPAADLFRPLVETGTPVLGVLGNHDWYGYGPRMAAALAGRGVTMLDNRRVFVDADRRLMRDATRGALCLAGFGDLLEDVVDPDAALGDIDPGTPRIVLSHNPDAAELATVTCAGGPRIDLMLSGHTHGGQVRLPLVGSPIVPSRYGQKYAGGLVRGPAFPVVISRGVGMSILPVRFGVPPEVVEVMLVRV